MSQMAPLVLAIGLLLALPTVRGAVGGQIDPGTAVARFLMGLAVAWVALSLLKSVVSRQSSDAAQDPAGASPAEGATADA